MRLKLWLRLVLGLAGSGLDPTEYDGYDWYDGYAGYEGSGLDPTGRVVHPL